MSNLINQFPQDKMLALFLLAGIKVLGTDEIPNQYWPRTPDYLEIRDKSPWWLVYTEFGTIKIGWRKRVIEIDWRRLELGGGKAAVFVTQDDVTKDDYHVHAYSELKAVEYLHALKCHLINQLQPKSEYKG